LETKRKRMNFQDGEGYIEEVSLKDLAKAYGTPLYVYSGSEIINNWRQYDSALTHRKHLVCYAVKANSNLGVLSLLAELGSGFDIVSGGELSRVLVAGGSANKIVFSGTGKSEEDLKLALEVGIHCFNIESTRELERLNIISGEMGKIAPISLRVNPNVDPKTHPYISTGLKENKFGIDLDEAPKVYQRAKELKNLKIIGVDCHIGSQLLTTKPIGDAVRLLLGLIQRLKEDGIELEHVDIGGGIGVRYKDENPPSFKDFVHEVDQVLVGTNFPYTLLVEPGRSIVANAGFLITKVEYIKKTSFKNFVIIDGAMNDLIRPALYESYHEIVRANQNHDNLARICQQQETPEEVYDVVGPICESGDFLGKGRHFQGLQEGDLLVIKSAGAYGFSMSSNYNSRPRAAEVMVHQTRHQSIRKRETITDLFSSESIFKSRM